MTSVASLTTGSAPRRVIPESRLATLPLLGIGTLVAVILIAFAGGYGYHRDELYFLVAGRHLAWAYADQGPLTPLIAHIMDAIAPGSLTVLRIPSAVMAAGTVFLTGALARELGGRSRAQLIAAGSAAVASVVLVTGHLLSTSTFDLLAWTLLTWLIARTVRTANERLWPVAGVTAGLALLNKPLIAFLPFALAVGAAVTGPRRLLRSRWLGAGVALAILLWSPWLVWQAAHEWPQLKVSSSIARGGSASSQPRWALVPFQFVLVSPVLCPVWIAGLWSLWRRPTLRPYRFFALAWLVLVVVFLATAGKPYYLAGMFPVPLAAGAGEVDEWLKYGHRRVRASLLAFAFASSGVVSAVIALPVLSARDAGPVIAANADVGETIGWPELVRTVAVAYRRAGRGTVIFTSNYGEAGAIDRYGPALGLPDAYSGHNAFWPWGPPSNRHAPVVVVGLNATQLQADFQGCRLNAQITNNADVNNDERGRYVALCAAPRGAWSHIWPRLRHLG